MCAAMRRNCACARAEQNLQRLEDVIGQLASQMSALKRQAREAIRYREVSAKVRKQEATLYHLRWINANKEVEEADRARDLGTREVAAAMLAQTEAAKKQESVAAALPPLREDEARAAAALQRLVIARETLDREEERARERLAELGRRLVQLNEDIAREKQLATDAEWALNRLAAEKDALDRRSAGRRRQARRDRGSAWRKPTRCWPAPKKLRRTHRRARRPDRAAQPARKRRARAGRTAGQIRARDRRGRGRTREAQCRQFRAPRSDAAQIRRPMPAQNAVTEAEAATVRAEAAHSAARQALDVARRPLADAERRTNRLEAEAKALAKVLHVDAKNLWPAIIDDVKVEKGYEAALGAALGRRPRSAGRSEGADALERRGDRSGRSETARTASSR